MQMVPRKTRTDPAILSARRKMRDRLKDEWAHSDDHARHIARDVLARASVRRSIPKENAIVYATSQLGAAVIASMGVNAAIHVKPSVSTSAYTDFKSIYVNVNTKQYDIKDPSSITNLVHFTKGLLYHEVGHIKYTINPSLIYMGLNNSGGIDTGIPSWKDYREAWNFLEDQRMECHMVRYSPIMRQYFTSIVLDHVVSIPEMAWPLVAGRTYLSKDILTIFSDAAHTHIDSYDATLVHDTSATVAKYKRASTPEAMNVCVIEYVDILYRWKSKGILPNYAAGHDSHPNDQPDLDSVRDKISQTADENAQEPDVTPPTEPSSAADDASSESSGDADGNSSVNGNDNSSPNNNSSPNGNSGGAPDDTPDDFAKPGYNRTADSNGPTGGRGATHSGVNPTEVPERPTLKQQVKELLEDSLRTSPVSDHDAKEFMGMINDELSQDYTHNVMVAPFTEQDMSDVEEVFNGMMVTLEPLAVQADPAWRFRQEQGVLDPTSFVMREPGDTDFWSDLDDIGGRGFDISVSVSLDVSGSMEGLTCDVGIAALGIRMACDALNIPCTVTTFADSAEYLWKSQDQTTYSYPTAKGGTDPKEVLESLDNQRFGKSRHLVIFLTDGAWSGIANIAPYSAPGRFFFIVGIGWISIDYLERLGADAVAVIDKPSKLAEFATQALSGFLM